MERRKVAMCPTCKRSGEFEFIGEQRWPRDVAASLNLPPIINLWGCPHCHSTISETELAPAHRDLIAPPTRPGVVAARKRPSPLAVVPRGRWRSSPSGGLER